MENYLNEGMSLLRSDSLQAEPENQKPEPQLQVPRRCSDSQLFERHFSVELAFRTSRPNGFTQSRFFYFTRWV